MRTFGRWFARLSIITSAMLCIGVCLLWLRSGRTIDSVALVPRPTSIDQPEAHITAWEADSFSGRLRLLAIQMQGPWPRLPWRESDDFHVAWPIGSPEHRAPLNVIQGNLLQVHGKHCGINYDAGLSWGFAYFPVRIVTLPLWMPGILFAIAPALWLARRVFKRRPRRGQCSFCRYNLTGNASGICPECGRRITEF